MENGAATNRAGRRIDLIVEKVQSSLVRKSLFAGDRHLDRHSCLTRAGALAFAREVDVALKRLLVGFEGCVDRIERDHCGQQRGFSRAAGDEVPRSDDRAAHTSINWRRHSSELEIQFRCAECRFDCGSLRRRLLGECRPAITLFGRHRVFARELIGALQFAARPLHGRPCAIELRAQTIDFSLERARVDLEEQIALLHQCSLVEADRGDIPRYPRPDGHRIHRLQPSGKLIPLRHVARDHLGDRDFGRGRGTGGLCGRAVARRPQSSGSDY